MVRNRTKQERILIGHVAMDSATHSGRPRKPGQRGGGSLSSKTSSYRRSTGALISARRQEISIWGD